AIFGLVTGVLLISFASTLGATLACIMARFLLREWVQGKFAERLQVINDGIAREGAFYLFTLRLIPLCPFFVINLVMGLSKMPIRTYFWVSQVGMLPGTIVYVNAGRELSRIDSLSDIMSPRLILAFALLGILPLLSKKIIGWYQSLIGGE
ncbi:TVP38/TMEM64 family protein, partial [bacterium]|nr:TVP38/TMEM64 family protein [bacterium]